MDGFLIIVRAEKHLFHSFYFEKNNNNDKTNLKNSEAVFVKVILVISIELSHLDQSVGWL